MVCQFCLFVCFILGGCALYGNTLLYGYIPQEEMMLIIYPESDNCSQHFDSCSNHNVSGG